MGGGADGGDFLGSECRQESVEVVSLSLMRLYTGAALENSDYVYPDIPRFLFCFVLYFYKMTSVFFKTPRT